MLSVLSNDGQADDGRVAVIIPAWRAAEIVAKAVRSALVQPEAAEVVVVDDGSGDGGATADAAREADDGTGRLQVIELEANAGPARARNIAIAATSSRWICPLDSDDRLAPGRLRRLLHEARDGFDFVADDVLQVVEGASPESSRQLCGDRPMPQTISLDYFVRGNLSKRGRLRRELGFLQPMMCRRFLQRHAIQYDETLRIGEDYDLCTRALANGARFRFVPWPGYICLQRQNSITGRHGPADLAPLVAADDRLLKEFRLTKAERRSIKRHRFLTLKRLVTMRFNQAVSAGRLSEAAGVVLGNPFLAPTIARGFLDYTRKKKMTQGEHAEHFRARLRATSASPKSADSQILD
jgi:succinoglycan biosynthesis protein ExoU